MSHNLEANNGNNEKSIFNRSFSRRRFLQGMGTTAAALAAMKFAPAIAAPEAQDIGAEQDGNGWGELPIVSGEPAREGQVVMPEAGVMRFDNGMNSRDKNTTVGTTKTARQAGTFFEVKPGEENMLDAENDPRYTWTGGDIVLDPTVGVIEDPAAREHIYVANNQGNTTLLTEANQLPGVLQDLYRVPAEAVPATSEFAVSGITAVFDKFGGTEEFSEQTAKAWGVEIPDGTTFSEMTVDSPLHAWQYATAIAASGTSPEAQNEVVDVGFLAGETSPLAFYRHINKDNTVDVIGRAINADADDNNDIFIITRYENSPVVGTRVQGVGFTTPEGLAAAYGDEAGTIADSVTALSGTGTEELMTELNDPKKTKKTRVFLAGKDIDSQFAPKVTGNGDFRYERRGDYYFAVDHTTGKEKIYVPNQKEWVVLGEPEKMRELVDMLDISVGNQTLWEGLVDGRISKEYMSSLRHMNQVVIDGDIEWNKVYPNGQELVRSDRADKVIEFADMNKMAIQGHHLVWGLHSPGFLSKVPDWLANGSFTREQINAIISGHIEQTIAFYPEVSSWSVVNEPRLDNIDIFTKHGGTENVTVNGETFTIPAYIRPALEAARIANPTATLFINKGGTIGPDAGDLTFNIARALRGQTVEINGQSYPLIDAVGEQGHIDGANAPSYQAMKDRFSKFLGLGLDVKITELDVDMSAYYGADKLQQQARVYADVLNAYFDALWENRGSIESADISFFGVSDKVSWFEFTGKPDANATLLDDEFKQKPAYTAVMDVFRAQYAKAITSSNQSA
ncbi:endo-1,4-beta-xylanase [Candidatus Roizmanbacteria bacterium]|nr:MAG: endo-1,4-beta-xylanase [Candidatus Roizmanbacteria bacterium]